MKTIITLLSINMVITMSLHANEGLIGKVTSVVDGNTIEISDANDQIYKVILAGIDCPELEQQFGEIARRHLEKLILNKEVILSLHGKDRRGNIIAVVLIKGKDDPRVNLLKEGFAWTTEKNPDPELESHRTKAMEKGRGLWKDKNPIPPWMYRRQSTMLSAKTS